MANHHHQVPAASKALNGSTDPGELEGARRATGNAPGSAPAAGTAGVDSEVVAESPKRNHRSNAEKRRILAAADRCTRPGELGALLRKEGVYSSSLHTWRQQRERAELEALAPKKRGPKVDPNRGETLQISKLTGEVERLQGELEKAMLIIGIQKKLATLLGRPVDDETGNS